MNFSSNAVFSKGCPMRISTTQTVAVAVLLVLAQVAPAMAQARGGRGGAGGGVQIGAGGGQQNSQAMQQAVQQIGQRLQEGERVLGEASERATEVRQAWQKVDTEHKQNLRELAQAKKFAEEEAKNSPELKSAKDKLEQLRGELADVRKKVIETLSQENEDYQKAVKVHEKAVAEQKANTGSGVSSELRKELAKKVSEADKAKKTIEEVVMADNTDAKELVKQIKEATAELGVASKRKNEMIETDPKLNSAKTAFLRTRDELKQAKSELDQADGETNRIRSAMRALINQRAALQDQINLQQRQQQGGQQGGQQYGNRGGR